MGTGGASAWGLRSLADTFLRYFQPGLPCYLRSQVVDANGTPYGQIGFMPPVSGALSGFNDVLIDPAVDSSAVSLHNIGIMGGRLQFGARRFLISNLFVLNQMDIQNLTDPYQVWRGPLVMGLFYNQRLYSIEDIGYEEVGSEITLWSLTCNSTEIAAPSS
jgi:hypothetical protein